MISGRIQKFDQNKYSAAVIKNIDNLMIILFNNYSKATWN